MSSDTESNEKKKQKQKQKVGQKKRKRKQEVAGESVGRKSSRKRKHKTSAPSEERESPHSDAAMNQDSTTILTPESPVSASDTSNKLTDRAIEQYRLEQSTQEEFDHATIENSDRKYAQKLQECKQKHFADLAGLKCALEKDLRNLEEEHGAEITELVNISDENRRKLTEKYKTTAWRDAGTQTGWLNVVASTCHP
ncbi:hypothetical protein AA0119_g12475 [Alternaria tenuissima]|uniref:Uncharacterized protein n=2 Tax=Alternaria alternata complex TaxID=187734 RepID=A0A4Q4MYJ7_ALTAL|nr:hypothetical protein AA0117_g12663 [Alternaria alternata]RYN87316.1 hypothetical protein AA0119_g12475 [Alternaria tenuissima]RYO04377.1 hypothetical protein AA0121_g12826 [Alternaria tenuissima]RYO47996.1 hypothetical protein AA0116_g12829 [Alternaria tenuissima]